MAIRFFIYVHLQTYKICVDRLTKNTWKISGVQMHNYAQLCTIMGPCVLLSRLLLLGERRGGMVGAFFQGEYLPRCTRGAGTGVVP